MTSPSREHFPRFSFDFLGEIGCRPVSNHLQLVAFFAGADSLIFFGVRRKHCTVWRRAAVQFHEMSLAKIDILFPISPVAYGFSEQFATCFSKLGQVDPVL